MKRTTYQTIDGGTVTVLRPENEQEAATLEAQFDDSDQPLDARHSFGDQATEEKETDEDK